MSIPTYSNVFYDEGYLSTLIKIQNLKLKKIFERLFKCIPINHYTNMSLGPHKYQLVLGDMLICTRGLTNQYVMQGLFD